MASSSFLWRKILNYIEEKHTESVVMTLFDDVEVIDLKDDKFVIYTPNPFRKPIIDTQGVEYLKEAMRAIGYQDVSIVVLDDASLKEYRNSAASNEELSAITQDFTFDTFVVGPTNRFAHAAAQAVAETPAMPNYNPLLIYGESGLGKTHLLYAIANVIKEKHPDFKIVYVKGDQFTNEMIAALRAGKNVEFRDKYRNADLFLMDDLQFIAGKDSTQEEFFHTFNTLYENKKQIVLTSDRPPQEMNRLEERIKTRVQWGLQADVKPPDYETRVAIIQNKTDFLKVDLPPEIVHYIAENVTSNVRQIEGTINKIMAYRDMDDFDMTLTGVARAVKDMFKGKEAVLPTAQLIISEVASYYNLSESAIRGTARDKTTAEARQVAMYLILNMTNFSLEECGMEFGKDHTTVMYSRDKITARLAKETHMQEVLKEITSSVNGKV